MGKYLIIQCFWMILFAIFWASLLLHELSLIIVQIVMTLTCGHNDNDWVVIMPKLCSNNFSNFTCSIIQNV